ncbi:MAG: Na-translocating system protein MpsC family protein [Thermincola sp.]|nr:Na-translocating system protein MpsC family protein [Thermincola sp.]MDT3702442.1 Na-translocating system protein MpsC family protein [Thermincola sp.]
MEPAEMAYLKHVLLAEVKKTIKDLYGKGAEKIEMKISDYFIFIEWSGYLRMSELNLIRKQSDQAKLISNYRKAISEGSRDIIIQRFENVLKRKVTNFIFECDIPNNTAVFLFLLEEKKCKLEQVM